MESGERGKTGDSCSDGIEGSGDSHLENRCHRPFFFPSPGRPFLFVQCGNGNGRKQRRNVAKAKTSYKGAERVRMKLGWRTNHSAVNRKFVERRGERQSA